MPPSKKTPGSSLKDLLLTSDDDLPLVVADGTPSSASRIYLLDGGVSTHLRDLWQQDFQYPELWSSSLLLTKKGRSVILRGHKDWLHAGSNILTTVTYQCHSLSGVIDVHQMDQMLRDGVQLAHSAIQEVEETKTTTTTAAASEGHFVVASIGCYGAALADGSEYTGNYPAIKQEQDLVDFHRTKTRTLLEEHPDGIALETVPCVQECRAFLSLLLDLTKDTELPACWISLACRNSDELNDGSKLEEALKAIHELDPGVQVVQAIGINCCDSGHIASLVRRITTFFAQKWHSTIVGNPPKQQQCRGIVIYPNSGEEWDADTKSWKEGTGLRHDDLQDVFATRLLEAVAIVSETWKQFHPTSPPPTILLGGCCRTRPETIQALRKELDKRRLQEKEKQKASSRVSKEQSSPNNAAGVTAEQQRMINQILGLDADFDRQLGDRRRPKRSCRDARTDR